MTRFRVAPVSADFKDWGGLHRLLNRAFADMAGRIDPPSSLTAMTVRSIMIKAETEKLVLAYDGKALAGCGFGRIDDRALYLSKLAVDPDYRRRGLMREIVAQMEVLAKHDALSALTLQTRVELTGNHAVFRALGFEKVGETAHPGYDRPTSFTFRKEI